MQIDSKRSNTFHSKKFDNLPATTLYRMHLRFTRASLMVREVLECAVRCSFVAATVEICLFVDQKDVDENY